MKKTGRQGAWLFCGVLLMGGCGAIPEFLAEAARASAEEALRGTIEGVVGTVIDESVSGLLEATGLDAEFMQDDEEVDEDALEESDEELDEATEDEDRLTRR